MQMEAGLDTGPVLSRAVIPIEDADTAATLHDRLATLGADLLAAALEDPEALVAEPQPETGVTYAHKLEKHEAKLDWSQPARALANKVRAFNPWPIAEAELAGERVRIHGAIALAEAVAAAPGTLVRASRDGIDVAFVELVTSDAGWTPELLGFGTDPYPIDVQRRLLDPVSWTVAETCQANFRLGHLFADAIVNVAGNLGLYRRSAARVCGLRSRLGTTAQNPNHHSQYKAKSRHHEFAF